MNGLQLSITTLVYMHNCMISESIANQNQNYSDVDVGIRKPCWLPIAREMVPTNVKKLGNNTLQIHCESPVNSNHSVVQRFKRVSAEELRAAIRKGLENNPIRIEINGTWKWLGNDTANMNFTIIFEMRNSTNTTRILPTNTSSENTETTSDLYRRSSSLRLSSSVYLSSKQPDIPTTAIRTKSTTVNSSSLLYTPLSNTPRQDTISHGNMADFKDSSTKSTLPTKGNDQAALGGIILAVTNIEFDKPISKQAMLDCLEQDMIEQILVKVVEVSNEVPGHSGIYQSNVSITCESVEHLNIRIKLPKHSNRSKRALKDDLETALMEYFNGNPMDIKFKNGETATLGKKEKEGLQAWHIGLIIAAIAVTLLAGVIIIIIVARSKNQKDTDVIDRLQEITVRPRSSEAIQESRLNTSRYDGKLSYNCTSDLSPTTISFPDCPPDKQYTVVVPRQKSTKMKSKENKLQQAELLKQKSITTDAKETTTIQAKDPIPRDGKSERITFQLIFLYERRIIQTSCHCSEHNYSRNIVGNSTCHSKIYHLYRKEGQSTNPDMTSIGSLNCDHHDSMVALDGHAMDGTIANNNEAHIEVPPAPGQKKTS